MKGCRVSFRVHLLRRLGLVWLGAGLIWACRSEPSGLHDLIQPVVLTAGERDTLLVSDLFYAEDYALEFRSHPHLRVQYDPARLRLVLEPAEEFEGFTALAFTLHGREYHIPVFSRVKPTHVFRFRPPRKPRYRLNVMGNFNDWNRNGLPMQDEDGDGVYERAVALDPGQYLYQFVYDSSEIWDPANPIKVDNGFGGFNSVVSIPPRHAERAFLHLLEWQATSGTVVLSFYYEREKQPEPLAPEHVFGWLDNRRLPAPAFSLTGNRIDLRLDRRFLQGQRVVRLAVTQAGLATNLQTVRLVDGRPAGATSEFTTWYDAVLYALMIDRFYDGDPGNSRPIPHPELSPKLNYQGGDLQGILEKLNQGYFDSLGVNALWLSPVNDNTDKVYREWPPPHRYVSAYHGYWPIHHQRVEERFGDLDLLKTVVQAAHARGIKVLLDFTANHVHEDHPFFQQHRDWFGTVDLPDGRKNIRLWDEHRLTTWFEPFLPSFDYLGSDTALQVMTDNAVWWLRQTGVDGFRHDAVKHIPNRFWRVLTRKIKREIEIPEGRRIYQIGETFGSYDLIRSYVNNGQLNAQFNFNLYDVALYVFLNPEAGFEVLDKELQKTFAIYGVNHLMGNVMDSHDKVRFLAYADGDLRLNSNDAVEKGWTDPPVVDHASSYEKARLYLTYLLTIPGVPVLYYGDEIGMTGAADPDNRRMMRFGEQLNPLERKMLQDVRRLVHLRRRHSALRYGDFQTLLADRDGFVYLRSDLNERVLVALNKSEQTQRRRVPLPEVYDLRSAVDLISGERLPVANHALDLRLAPLQGRVFRVER